MGVSGILSIVSLRFLRRLAHLWLARPVGRLASLLLLAAVMSAGVPAVQVHAHVDGDHDHDHAVQIAGDGIADQDDQTGAESPDGDTVLHAHDVCMTLTALVAIPMTVPNLIGLAALNSRTPGPPPLPAALLAPHRPPIA